MDYVFILMGDALTGEKAGQMTPGGCYNLKRMLSPITRKGDAQDPP